MSGLFTVWLCLFFAYHPCTSKMFRCAPIDPEGHELAILTFCTLNMSLQTGQTILWGKSSETIGECVTESICTCKHQTYHLICLITCSSTKGTEYQFDFGYERNYLYFSFGISSSISRNNLGEYYIYLDKTYKTLALNFTNTTHDYNQSFSASTALCNIENFAPASQQIPVNSATVTNPGTASTENSRQSTYSSSDNGLQTTTPSTIQYISHTTEGEHSTYSYFNHILVAFSVSLLGSLGATCYFVWNRIKKRQRTRRNMTQNQISLAERSNNQDVSDLSYASPESFHFVKIPGRSAERQ